MAKGLQPGDVFELTVPGGFGYFHYVGAHEFYGHGIAVSPHVYPERPPISDAMFADAYVTFYPVKAAMGHRLVSIVGKVAPKAMPKVMRRAGVRVGRCVETWVIENEEDGREIVKTQLSDAERRLPIAGICNHECLVHDIETGWRPEHEV